MKPEAPEKQEAADKDESAPGAFARSRAGRAWVLRAGVAAAAYIAAARLSSGASGLPLDDAYIHLTFARNLADGMGIGFNPGEFSLGFSSPLWIGLMAAAKLAGADLVSAARQAGMVALGISAALLFDIVRLSVRPLFFEKTEDRDAAEQWSQAFGLIAGLGIAASGNMLWLGASGMEATLFLALGLASILLLHPGGIRPAAGGVGLALLLLTRVTGLTLWVVAAAAIAGKANRKKIAAALALALALFLPWAIYSYLSTGYFLPPTRAGKLASHLFSSGLSFKGAKDFVLFHLFYLYQVDRSVLLLGFFGILAGLALLANRIKKGACGSGTGSSLTRALEYVASLSPAGILVLWALIHFFVHSQFFRSGPIITPYHNLRYQVMLIPAVIAGSAYALARLGLTVGAAREEKREGGGARAASGIAILIAMLFLAAPLVGELFNARQWQSLYRAGVRHLSFSHRQAAEWARDNLPKDARIACLDIGILGYYSDRYIVDLGGLIDPASLRYLKAFRMGPYLIEKRATHYFKLFDHEDENITGIMKDRGTLYDLDYMARFDSPRYRYPVFLHSFGIEVYRIRPLRAEGATPEPK